MKTIAQPFSPVIIFNFSVYYHAKLYTITGTHIQRGGVAKSSNQMIERYPCSSSTNKKSSVFLFQENLLDFGVL